eukprot:10778277-Lingulodinium_polyedra.AAC.1
MVRLHPVMVTQIGPSQFARGSSEDSRSHGELPGDAIIGLPNIVAGARECLPGQQGPLAQRRAPIPGRVCVCALQ